jgi:hypothetical protein
VKPHIAVKVVPTPGGNDGSLHVEVPSAGLSRPFGCCPRFQNDEICVGIRVSVRGGSHTVSDQASMGASETLERPFIFVQIFPVGSVAGNGVLTQHRNVRMSNSLMKMSRMAL